MSRQFKMMIEVFPFQIDAFLKTVREYNETCYVLYRVKEGDAQQFLNRIRIDHGTEYFAMMENNDIVAVARLTKNPVAANGMLGYYVLPTKRNKGIATELLHCMMKFARKNRLLPLTAVVHTKNSQSMHILVMNGFKPTGNVYDWIPEPEERKAIEFAITQ